MASGLKLPLLPLSRFSWSPLLSGLQASAVHTTQTSGVRAIWASWSCLAWGRGSLVSWTQAIGSLSSLPIRDHWLCFLRSLRQYQPPINHLCSKISHISSVAHSQGSFILFILHSPGRFPEFIFPPELLHLSFWTPGRLPEWFCLHWPLPLDLNTVHDWANLLSDCPLAGPATGLFSVLFGLFLFLFLFLLHTKYARARHGISSCSPMHPEYQCVWIRNRKHLSMEIWKASINGWMMHVVLWVRKIK